MLPIVQPRTVVRTNFTSIESHCGIQNTRMYIIVHTRSHLCPHCSIILLGMGTNTVTATSKANIVLHANITNSTKPQTDAQPITQLHTQLGPPRHMQSADRLVGSSQLNILQFQASDQVVGYLQLVSQLLHLGIVRCKNCVLCL